jgi:ribosome biogenesis GTPase
MNLTELGLNTKISDSIINDNDGFETGRIIREHKERYTLQSPTKTILAEITGNMRYSATDNMDFPAVGDWVKYMPTDEKNGIIFEIYPRYSVLKRKAVGSFGDVQLIATNIDYAFIVQSVGQDFNINRFERYISLCNSGKIKPIILLTKTDLVSTDETNQYISRIKERIDDIDIHTFSIKSVKNIELINSILLPYKTYCFIGSSGVGKSTLINSLKDDAYLKTQEISEKTNKGKHTTTHRELIILPNKSIVIDTPGMREIGMAEDSEGIDKTYNKITELANNCKFNDCTHENEKGCAVLEAISQGIINEQALLNYKKLKREQAHFSSTIKEKRDKDKSLGKLYKKIMNEKKWKMR